VFTFQIAGLMASQVRVITPLPDDQKGLWMASGDAGWGNSQSLLEFVETRKIRV
jgi:hypothetical protein